MLLRLEAAATTRLADQVRKKIRASQKQLNEDNLRLVAEDEEPKEIKEIIEWEEYPENIFLPNRWVLAQKPNSTFEIRRIVKTENKVDVILVGAPILPVRKLIDIDTGEWSIELAWMVGDKWHKELTQRVTALDTRGLLSLANRGAPVSSHNSKLLVEFIATIDQDKNLPVHYSVVRLGWVGNKTKMFMLGNSTTKAKDGGTAVLSL
jgi:hypothetical protein